MHKRQFTLQNRSSHQGCYGDLPWLPDIQLKLCSIVPGTISSETKLCKCCEIMVVLPSVVNEMKIQKTTL